MQFNEFKEEGNLFTGSLPFHIILSINNNIHDIHDFINTKIVHCVNLQRAAVREE